MSIQLGKLSTEISVDSKGFVKELGSIRNIGWKFAQEFSSNMSNLSSTFSNVGQIGARAFSNISNNLGNVSNSLRNTGTSITKYITLPIAGAGVGIFKLGKDFERELSKVVGLVGVSQKQVNAWGKEIIQLAPELARPPQELAEALFFVTSAGLRGADAMDVLKMSGKAAAAGLGETKTIADLVTSAINAYGKENLTAAQATDIVTAAVREGKAEASELAGSLGQVLPLASELGVTFDQVAATQAAMTKTGTPAAEAATQLKSIMAGMIKPSKQASEQLDKMGTSAKAMRKKIKEEGLLNALMDLRKMTNKYGEEAMARVFPNIRALLGVLDLMGSNLKGNIKTFDAVKNSTGMLDEAFKAASNTLDFKWNQALSKVKATALTFFDNVKSAMLPVLDRLISVLDWVSKKFSSLPKSIQKAIIIFTAIIGIVGPVILGVSTALAALSAGFGALSAIVSAVAGVLGTIGLPAILAIAGVIAVVVAAVGTLIGSFVYLWKTNDEFRAKVLKTWEVIKKSGINIFYSLKDTIMYIFDGLKSFWDEHGDTISKIFFETWDWILDIVQKFAKDLEDIINILGNVIRGDWGKAWENIKKIAKREIEFIETTVADKFSKIGNVIKRQVETWKKETQDELNELKDSFIEWADTTFSPLIDPIVEFKTRFMTEFESIRDSIAEKLGEWGAVIQDWFMNFPEKIGEQLAIWKETIMNWAMEQNEENKKQFAIWGETIIEWFASIPEQIGELLGEWFNKIKEWFTSIPGKLGKFFSIWSVKIIEFFIQTKEKIKNKLVEWWERISTFFKTAPGKISNFLSNWWESMKKWFTQTVERIKNKLNEWWTAIKNWFTNLPNKPEVKNAGKNMINKVSQGTKEKKADFMDKLGKIIVDVAKGALIIAGIAIVATGREIIKRLISGIKQVNLKGTGKSIIQSLIDGIKGMYGSVEKVCYNIAKKIRDYFPFSPAKKGPLMDLDNVDFYSSLKKSINKAKSKISIPSMQLGNEIIDNIEKNSSINLSGIGGTSKNVNFNGDMHFNGVQDVYQLLNEMKSLIYKHTGRTVF